MPFSLSSGSSSGARPPLVKRGWLRVLLCLVVYLALWFALRRLTGFQVRNLAIDLAGTLGLDTRHGASVLFALITLNLPMIIAVVACRRFLDRGEIAALGLRRSFVLERLGIGMLIAGTAVCAVFFFSLLIEVVSLERQDWSPAFGEMALNLAFHLVVAFTEGLLIIGYVASNMRDHLNGYSTAIISALVFSAAHVLNPDLTVVGILNLFLIGLAMALYYVEKGDLWLPIGAHWAWNVIQGPVLGYNVSGYEGHSVIALMGKGPDLLTGGRFGFEGSIIVTVVLVLIVPAAAVYARKTRQEEDAV